jgi:hypothetical protein
VERIPHARRPCSSGRARTTRLRPARLRQATTPNAAEPVLPRPRLTPHPPTNKRAHTRLLLATLARALARAGSGPGWACLCALAVVCKHGAQAAAQLAQIFPSASPSAIADALGKAGGDAQQAAGLLLQATQESPAHRAVAQRSERHSAHSRAALSATHARTHAHAHVPARKRARTSGLGAGGGERRRRAGRPVRARVL